MAIGSILCRACQDESNDVRIVKIQARMWKLWLVENHKWMKKKKKMKTLDEKYDIQIMDELNK